MLWKYFDLEYLSFTELKETISKISRALIYLGMEKDDVFNAYARTRYFTPAWSAGQILSAYSRTQSSFQLFSNMSSPR
jgi:hypothetical protein